MAVGRRGPAPQDLRRGARASATGRSSLRPSWSCPTRAGRTSRYYGWAYCARTPERDLFLIYFENEAPLAATLRGVRAGETYRPTFFDPREGKWLAPGEPIAVAPSAVLTLPERPDQRDWGLMLERV